MKFNALIPELSVTDIQNSLHFYTNILNFKIEYERKEDLEIAKHFLDSISKGR